MKEEIIIALQDFFGQRLRGILTDKGFGYDTVEAVLGAGLDDIYSVVQRAEALAAFREEDSFQGLLTAFNRANNLAKGYTGDLTVNPALFETKAEEALYTTLVQGEEFVSKQLSVRDYQGILKTLETLQKPVDEFFETVMVMVDDPKVRDNRLALLKRIAILAAPVADLRKIMMA